MINSYSALTKKTIELESQLEELKNNFENTESSPNCIVINKNFSNLEILLTKRVSLSKITFGKDSSLFFQGQVEIVSSANQEIIVSLLVNSTCAQKIVKDVSIGSNSIPIFCNFTPISVKNIYTYIKIEPKSQKAVYLQNISVAVWGASLESDDLSYQALELDDNYLISMLYNQTLYYKIIPKEKNEFLISDMDFIDYVVTYSFVKITNDVLLFKVNERGDLFYSKLSEMEKFITGNVTAVSAVSTKNETFVFFIQNNACFQFQIDSENNISNFKKIECNNYKIKNVYAYCKKETDKVYIVLTDINNSNFLLEQINETKKQIENISANFNITFDVYRWTMELNLHNKIEVKINGKTYTFFNTMLKSVRLKLKNLESYSDFIAVGNGSNSSVQENFKLGNFVSNFMLETEVIQDNPESETLYIKKNAIISGSKFDGMFLTEAGITSELSDNPTIFNYFSLISDEFPNGILKENGKEIVLSVYIYLTLTADSFGKLTLGENKFIDFLLGQGLNNNKIFACRGKNLSENTPIYRESFDAVEKYECSLKVSETDDNISLTLSADIKTDEAYEIVFFIGKSPFARINTRNCYKTEIEYFEIEPKPANVVDFGKNIKSIQEIKNLTTNKLEENFYVSNYATSFGDKITLPFNNLYDNQTPRFISKDSSKIFFISDDKITAFENKKYSIYQLKISDFSFKNIIKLIPFDEYLFVITKSEPYIIALIQIDGVYKKIDINYSDFSMPELLTKIFDIDITMGKNGNILFGIIDEETRYPYCLYFKINESKTELTYFYFNTTPRKFDLVFSMFKNNFCDSFIFYLKVGDDSFYTRLAYFYPDETYNDNYTTLAWHYVENAREIYIKNRAIVSEKTTNPSLWVILYPQKYKYSLSVEENEKNDYLSTNMLYLIQKMNNNLYKIYNLVGYNTPTEFEDGLPSEIDQSKILDFEFLNDTLLFFLNESQEPIVAYNLFENSTVVENVSSSEDKYLAKVEKYVLPGSKNEGVTVSFTVNINLWFFQKISTNFQVAKILHFI